MNESNTSALLLTRTGFVSPVLNVCLAQTASHLRERERLRYPQVESRNGGQNIQASNLLHERHRKQEDGSGPHE